MVRIHIIGLPSAGKTTLAAGLSSHFHVPHRDLDAVAFLDERWTMRPMADRDAMVGEILADPGFVSEGGFLGWVTPLFAASDRIVWLDPPLRILIWRHVRRHARLSGPGWLIARLRFQVLCYLRPAGKGPARFDPDQTRSGIEAALRPWSDKVLRVRRPVTLAEAIEELGPPPG
jgi:hypothetical protein